MSVITLKTTFDCTENLHFSAKYPDGSFAGVLQTKPDCLFFTDEHGKKTKYLDVEEVEKLIKEKDLSFNSPTASERKYIQYQPNPKQLNTGDCTIRAYTKAENISWEDAYDIASNFGMEVAALPDDPRVIDKVLIEHYGYKYIKLSKEEQITVNEFATANQFGTYILAIRKHLVTCQDGFYFDSWDSGDKKIKGYYTKE